MEYLNKIDEKVAEVTKDVDIEKVYAEVRAKNNITKEQWEKMKECEKIKIVAPKGIWNEE